MFWFICSFVDVIVSLFLFLIIFYWKELYGPVISTLTNTLCNYLDMHLLLIICDHSFFQFYITMRSLSTVLAILLLVYVVF